jgi:hypothetical protein
VCLPWLARGWSRQVLVHYCNFGGAIVVVDLSKRSTLPMWWSGGLAIADQSLLLTGFGWSQRHHGSQFFLIRIFPRPLLERALVQVQPMLLRSDHHPRSHESHERNDLVCGEPMFVYQVRSDQTPSPPKTSLAVHCDAFVLHCDHLVCESDEFADHWERWTRSVLKDHVHVMNAECGEV